MEMLGLVCKEAPLLVLLGMAVSVDDGLLNIPFSALVMIGGEVMVVESVMPVVGAGVLPTSLFLLRQLWE